MIAVRLLALVALSGVFSASVPLHPLSDEFIDHINSLQTTWKAGRNFDKDTPLSHIERLLGALGGKKHKTTSSKIHKVAVADEDIPDSFDAREKWPECESIRMIRDQSNWASDWAVAAAAAMSDRICISSNGTDQTLVSDEDLFSCCDYVGYGYCDGSPFEAWYQWTAGIVSGGPYNSTSGCKAYSMQPCLHHSTTGNLPACENVDNKTPQCVKQCDEGSSSSYEESKTFGTAYEVGSDDKLIQWEIMQNGPVEASFTVYTDFPSYKSGVYVAMSFEPMGKHAVRIIGWGVEKGLPYWLVTNSWNESWGENGLFKIIRGYDECGIESEVAAGIPRK